MIRPNGRNCCRRWPMGRRPPGASESLWTVCSLGGQASGFGRNQAPKTDRLNQVPPWEFRKRRKSFTPRQLARILWDFAYLCWANPDDVSMHSRWWQAPRFVTTGRRRCQTETIEMYGSRPTLIFAVVFVCQERARALSGFVSPAGSCVRQTVIRGSLGTLVL